MKNVKWYVDSTKRADNVLGMLTVCQNVYTYVPGNFSMYSYFFIAHPPLLWSSTQPGGSWLGGTRMKRI